MWGGGDFSCRAVGSGAAGAAQAAPLFMPIFFRRHFNFRVPRYHAPLEHSVRVKRGPRHYELAVCLISAYMEFFCVMLVHDLQCSEMLREQLLYHRKNKSQNFFALRAASDITTDGRSTLRELPTGLFTQ